MKTLLILLLLTACAQPKPAKKVEGGFLAWENAPPIKETIAGGVQEIDIQRLMEEIEKGNFSVLEPFFDTNQLFPIENSSHENFFIPSIPLYYSNNYNIKFINSSNIIMDSNKMLASSSVNNTFKNDFILIQQEITKINFDVEYLIQQAIFLQDFGNFDFNDIPASDKMIIYLMYYRSNLLYGYILENITTLERFLGVTIVDKQEMFDPEDVHTQNLYTYIFKKLLPEDPKNKNILFLNSLFQYPASYKIIP